MSFNPLANGASLCVIGGGRMGPALAWALHRAGFPLGALVVRSATRRQYLQQIFPANSVVSRLTYSRIKNADLVAIAVPDDAIPEVVAHLTNRSADWSNKFVFHLSGVQDSSVLEPLARAGAVVFSWHPILSVSAADPRSVQFAGAYADIEGPLPGLAMARKISTTLAMHAIEVTPRQKVAFHLAAVVYSNFLVGVAGELRAFFQHLEISPELSIQPFLPLLQSTLENLNKHSPEDALTGPIRRGDVDTVRRHLLLLQHVEHRRLRNIYTEISLALLKLAERAGLTPESRKALAEVLTSRNSKRE